ncbi:MAG: hypothetical protein ACI8RZ_002248 [Myxococcota bacterium]|jgi:hypothetical protein
MNGLPEDFTPGTNLRTLLAPEQWRALFSRVFVQHGLSVVGLAPETSGSDVVWGTPEAVVKLTAPRWVSERDAEAFSSTFLTGKLPFDTPPLIGTGAVDGWPYVITGRIGGVAVGRVWGGLTHDERLDLARRIGEATAILHAVAPPEGPDGWEDFLAAHCASLTRHHTPAPPAHLLAQLPDFMATPPAPMGRRAWLHTELLDEHIYVTESAGRWQVSGLLDFADGRVGEVGYDLVAPADFIFKGEAGVFPAFLEGYGLPGADPEGLLRWYLTHQFGRLGRLVQRVGAAEDLGALARRAFG